MRADLRPNPHPPAPQTGRRGASTAAWAAACVLLLGVTWVPLLGVHLNNMSRGDTDAGAMIAVFAPTLSAREVFARVADAEGSMIEPIRGWRQVWVVQSPEPGFAGRLRARGAWGVFAPELLSARALLGCFRAAPAADGALSVPASGSG